MSSHSSNSSKSLKSKKRSWLHPFTRKSKKPRHQPTIGDVEAPTTSPSLIAPSPTTQNTSWDMVPYTQEPGPIRMTSVASPTLRTFPSSSSVSGYAPTDFDSESIDSEYSEGYTSPSSHTGQVQIQRGYTQHGYTHRRCTHQEYAHQGYTYQEYAHQEYAHQGYTHQGYTHLHTRQSGHGSVTASAYQTSTYHSHPPDAAVGRTARYSRSGGGRSQTMTYTHVASNGHPHRNINIIRTNDVTVIF
ncbi:hypothetical protein P691DRAFT_573312 [Macrolepiota fuliginosa MF-IS2]|uniref:Uncharacterized protein n=1 Tax=Macrolepiota fuliginosa MF-IS2 TaxID=1400762 RepID=A0A9P6C2T3_9AGAR|nr:hypothetical protein P691DRAFT_573312 [Macrolepiota fuliginosa MF-IS2]